jgi:hypothetical protein
MSMKTAILLVFIILTIIAVIGVINTTMVPP